jgi:3-oxoacyl-[acyl-carrier protein] reductase
MDLGIEGRLGIVSGGSAGMGREAALALARAGVDLVVAARGAERLQATCAAIAVETGRRVTPVVADHGTAQGRARILAACAAPDILVITSSPPPETNDYDEINTSQWSDALATGFVGPLELMRATAKGMAQRRFGRIVCIASVAAKNPSIWRVLSGAPRAALVNYTTALAKRVAQDNVTVNAVLPGMFHTDATRTRYGATAQAQGVSYDEAIAAQVKRLRIPARRFGEAADIGALCAFLCSQNAGYLTGQGLVVDGGLTNTTF